MPSNQRLTLIDSIHAAGNLQLEETLVAMGYWWEGRNMSCTGLLPLRHAGKWSRIKCHRSTDIAYCSTWPKAIPGHSNAYSRIPTPKAAALARYWSSTYDVLIEFLIQYLWYNDQSNHHQDGCPHPQTYIWVHSPRHPSNLQMFPSSSAAVVLWA